MAAPNPVITTSAAVPVPTGAMDIERHVRFGTVVVPRLFRTLAAAREYLVSASTRAEQLVAKAKKDEDADDDLVRISDLFALSLGQLRPMVEEASSRDAHAPLLGLANQLASFSRMAAEKKDAARKRRACSLGGEAVVLVLLFFDLLLVNIPATLKDVRFFKFLSRISPFVVTVTWSLIHENVKEMRKVQNKKIQRFEELERVGSCISELTKSVCSFLAPPPAAEV